MLLVQQYLETRSFADLAREHGVYASLSKNKKKVSINYDMIETKDDDVLSWDCRGLILSKIDGSEFSTIDNKLDLSVIIGKTTVLAYPLRRFFNIGQGSAADINWSDPKLAILEKKDGTLCILYADPFTNQWCVATRSVCEADLLMDNQIYTFKTLFDKALKETTGLDFSDFTSQLNRHYTYCFELCTPLNRIVVAYPDYSVTLLAIRSLISQTEVDIEDFMHSHNMPSVPVVQAYTYTSIEDLLNWVSSLSPQEHEGVVVRDSNFNRIKVKNAAYVVASKMRDTLSASPRNCLEIILTGQRR